MYYVYQHALRTHLLYSAFTYNKRTYTFYSFNQPPI
nr:MAG TPA: hypothetical protein [Caudoviricetes sp.]